jgi:hypothetical protein
VLYEAMRGNSRGTVRTLVWKEPAPIRNAADGTVVVRGVSRPARTRLGKRKPALTLEIIIRDRKGRREASKQASRTRCDSNSKVGQRLKSRATRVVCPKYTVADGLAEQAESGIRS